jgi:hypothetical protein
MKNSLTVTSYEKHLTKNEDSWLTCKLSNGEFMNVSLYAFFHFVIENDLAMKTYANKFEEWELLINDLETLGYDFINMLSGYVQQFNEEDVKDITYSEELIN